MRPQLVVPVPVEEQERQERQAGRDDTGARGGGKR